MEDTGIVTSKDGTTIAWSREGSGSPLVLVNSVAVSRATTPQPTLPAALAKHFTVYSYDRRGKGESANTEPYTVEAEFDDLSAVIALAEGPVDVYGFSSGATLALLSADAGVPIRRLALLEPPLFPVPDPELQLRAEAQRRLDADVADAHRWFNEEVVGVPGEILEQFPPLSQEDLANTRTIVHELTFLPGTPAKRFAAVPTPTVLMTSNNAAAEIHEWAAALENAMPDAARRVLPGEWHGVDDVTLAEAICDHLLD